MPRDLIPASWVGLEFQTLILPKGAGGQQIGVVLFFSHCITSIMEGSHYNCLRFDRPS